MTDKEIEKLKKKLLTRSMGIYKNADNLWQLAYSIKDYELNKKVREICVEKSKEFKKSRPEHAEQYRQLYKKTLLLAAPVDFDSYCQYLEWNREPGKRFYLPRRKQLKPVAEALQCLAEEKLDLLAISMPPGTGKTTLAIFFLTWLAGKYPDKPMLTGSHSNSFLRGVYDECLRIMGKEGEYLWHEVFPNIDVERTNAADLAIDIGTPKRFATLQFTSVGSGNAGKVRAEGLLYCDDLVSGIEQALSTERLEKLWEQYSTDLRQRKIGNCTELHIATRWSTRDIIGKLEDKYANSDRAKFIVMPALDENDESNFDYTNSVGFTTEFYHDMRDTMDDASWRALYMNEPIERTALLYDTKELRRYFELPDGEPDAILACVDTKDKGKDYCAMPIVYQYGNDYYVEKILCDNSTPEIVESRLVAELLKHNVHMARFESNSAGGRIAEKVQKEITQRGGRTKITTKYTTANKETKILVNAPFVKERLLFKDETTIGDKEYKAAMNFLCNYSMAGKNKFDDVPDAFAQLAEYIQSLRGNKVQIFERFI